MSIASAMLIDMTTKSKLSPQKKKVLAKDVRKAIFVRPEVFERFKKACDADGRKYADYLETLMDKVGT